jgi:hypothetical protein
LVADDNMIGNLNPINKCVHLKYLSIARNKLSSISIHNTITSNNVIDSNAQNEVETKRLSLEYLDISGNPNLEALDHLVMP